MRMRRDAIVNDIALERFDHTLKSYQFKATRQVNSAEVIPEPKVKKYSFDLQELWDRFTEFQSTQIEKTTILTKYRAIANYIDRLSIRSLEDAPKIRDLILKTSTHYMAWEKLECFNRCCDWAFKSDLIPDNPFFKLRIKKQKKNLLMMTFERSPSNNEI
ncbi:hypothetical protein [Mastigocladopsis repens]|uniref:hypothetical protein n=1 Tax=Mastigocladopsis repens TaxID=221287 RepID=UPI001E3C3861|nr:hypothetical protein [Mastigocladopsis repens]